MSIIRPKTTVKIPDDMYERVFGFATGLTSARPLLRNFLHPLKTTESVHADAKRSFAATREEMWSS